MNLSTLIENPISQNLTQQQIQQYLQNIQNGQQIANNLLIQQDLSTQSSQQSLQQNIAAFNSNFYNLNGNAANTQQILQNVNPQFQQYQQIQQNPNTYIQSLALNEAKLLQNTLQQTQLNQQNNIYSNQKNQQMLYNQLAYNQEKNLAIGQNSFLQKLDMNGDQQLNQIPQNQLLQLMNKQTYENTQQQQQQQQQQQLQQQQQQQQQIQYYLLQQQLQQKQQQQQLSTPNINFERADLRNTVRRSFSGQDQRSLTNEQFPNELLLLNLKQEANGGQSDKISCFESPNMSFTTLPAPSIQRSSFSNISQSTSSSMSLGLHQQTSPLIQTNQEPQTSFSGMVNPNQLNLLLQQIQQQQQINQLPQFQKNQYSQIQHNQNPFNTTLTTKISQSVNEETRNQKSKKKSNPKRNTIKNLGNQIISFMCNKKSIKIIQKIPLIEFEEREFDEFKKFCEHYKNKMLKIADLRNIWISDKQNEDEQTLKYHKIIRVLSRFYLNNEAIPKLLTSNKLKDRKIHLSIRRILVEKLKDPESFTTLNQYSKK